VSAVNPSPHSGPEPDPGAGSENPAEHPSTVRGVSKGVGAWIGWLLIAPIRLYQRVLSPLRGPTCRYFPSCSQYAVTAIRVHGPVVGVMLASWRLLRCNPWTRGGVDHVPPRGMWRSIRPPYDPRADAPADDPSSWDLPHRAGRTLPEPDAQLRDDPPSRPGPASPPGPPPSEA
jgi:putative membrane protein insertion efficiency factor